MKNKDLSAKTKADSSKKADVKKSSQTIANAPVGGSAWNNAMDYPPKKSSYYLVLVAGLAETESEDLMGDLRYGIWYYDTKEDNWMTEPGGVYEKDTDDGIYYYSELPKMPVF